MMMNMKKKSIIICILIIVLADISTSEFIPFDQTNPDTGI